MLQLMVKLSSLLISWASAHEEPKNENTPLPIRIKTFKRAIVKPVMMIMMVVVVCKNYILHFMAKQLL